MKELLDQITKQFEVFVQETKNINNKAAARRARKASLELEKLFKEYRKQSLK